MKSVPGRQLKVCDPPPLTFFLLKKKKKIKILEPPELALFPVMDEKYTLIFSPLQSVHAVLICVFLANTINNFDTAETANYSLHSQSYF